MAEVTIKVVHDREGQTWTVWFADQSYEYVWTAAGDEVVLMRNLSGLVIGFEKFHFAIPEAESVEVVLETDDRRRT